MKVIGFATADGALLGRLRLDAGPVLGGRWPSGRQSTASLSSSSTAPRRDRLPVGRAGGSPPRSDRGCHRCYRCRCRFRCRRLRSRHHRARRSPHAFRLVSVGHLPVSTLVEYSVEQGRQDLNLQPAVLETAALPVELRPFRMALLAGPPVRGLHNLRAPRSADFQTDGQRAGLGKPRGPSVARASSSY